MAGVRETIRHDRARLGLVIVLALALPRCITRPASEARSADERAAASDVDEDEEPLPPCTAQPDAAPGPDTPSPPPGASVQTEPESGSEIRSAKEVLVGITRPHLLCKPAVTYSKEAFEHHVRGVALVRCVIGLDGWLSQCRMVKSLPYLDDHILASMMTWRFTPVLYQGHPQRVEMVFPVRVGAPR